MKQKRIHMLSPWGVSVARRAWGEAALEKAAQQGETAVLVDDQVIKRLLSRVTRSIDGSCCWQWHGSTDRRGYGLIGIRDMPRRAARVMFCYTRGELPGEMHVCHRCDNPGCVNPLHLFCGTMSDNMLDCSNKGRHFQKKKTHCPSGHEYSPENTLVKFRPGGRFRRCKICTKYYSLMRVQGKEKRLKDAKIS